MKSLLFTFLLVLSSCGGPRYVDFFPFYDDGMAKPKVVIMPMRVPEEFTGLDKELMSDIRYVAMDRGDLYLFPDSEVRSWRNKNPDIDFYGRDLTWTKNFQCAEFIAVLEAIEVNSTTSFCGEKKCTIKMRLKLVDLRDCEPKIILYELLETTQKISIGKTSSKCGSDNYQGEYRQLVKQVVDRLEKIIWSVK